MYCRSFIAIILKTLICSNDSPPMPIRTRSSFPPQSVSPIRKLLEASYSSPSEGRQTENHNHRKLTNLIRWTTNLSNSMKIWAMTCMAIRDGWVMVQSSDRMWSTGKGNGKPLQYSCLENPINSMKRWKKKIGHQKMNSPGRWCPICYWTLVET